MKKRLSKRLIQYAKRNPDGFTVYIRNGQIERFKPSNKKRYVVSKTNNNTEAKIKQSFRNDNYTGYAGGWYDKESGRTYIDKNIVFSKKEKAISFARKKDQLAIFDLLELKEITVQKKHGEWKSQKKQRIKKAEQKFKRKVGKLPVVKKDGKWYNTLTKRFVSESYAKRINGHFKRNPDSTLARATGHAKYSRKKPLAELPIDVKKLAYGKGMQLMKTMDAKGNTVYYSPFHDKVLSEDEVKSLKNLDYNICGGKVRVELYRLTRDRRNVYHIVTWEPNKRLTHPYMVDIWEPHAWSIYYCIQKELKKIAKKHHLGSLQNLYAHVGAYFYSDYDGWQSGKTFGFVIPNQSGFKILRKEFKELLDWYRNKLEIDSYHNIAIEKITFYIWNRKNEVSKIKYEKSKYRLGVNRT